jgi:predicted ATPase
MLVRRPAELERLDALLDGARAGRGGALVVRGDPGIGKTTLLDALAERADGECVVLRARGVETEAELAFSALADLLGPVLGERAVLPPPQAAALGAALALGPPAPGERLAVCVATVGLLRAAARLRPVVAIVDDVQWLDAASRESVLYAARRAGGRLAVALAVREPADPVLGRAGLPALALAPLDRAESLALLRHAAPDLAPSVAAALAEAAAGNPLALRELPVALTRAQRAGTAPLELPVLPGSRLHDAFAARIDELDPPAAQALLVAAAHAADDLPTISAACMAAGTDAVHLAAAEERGLVRLGDGHLSFCHPLIRAAAYHGAPPGERRAAHRALASVLRGERRA